jgi:hypothetical protein
MWLVLAFIGGAAVGFFTEDARPGRSCRWEGGSKFAGRTWGFLTIWLFHSVLGSYPQLSGWWLLAPALTAMLPPVTFFMPKYRNDPTHRIHRPLSNFERSFVKVIAVFGWFGFVPIPDTVRLTIQPNQPLIATFEQVLLVFLIAAVGVLLIALVGLAVNGYEQKALWARYRQIGHVNSLRRTKDNALFTEFLVKMGLRHWADARKALDLVEG